MQQLSGSVCVCVVSCVCVSIFVYEEHSYSAEAVFATLSLLRNRGKVPGSRECSCVFKWTDEKRWRGRMSMGVTLISCQKRNCLVVIYQERIHLVCVTIMQDKNGK